METKSATMAQTLLTQAQAGSGESLGRLLQLYANYLKLLILGQMERNLAARVSPSDVVQETFFEAHRDFAQFRGRTTPEFIGWLRRILVNNLYRVVEQHLVAEKRDARREVSFAQLATRLERSTARLESVLHDQGTSPSGGAQRREAELVLADEMAALAPDYRDVIVLRHLEGLKFEEIGRRMERSPGAVRMLWLRGIKQLRDRLATRGIR